VSEYEFYGTSALERPFSATHLKTFAEDGPALVAFYDSLAEQEMRRKVRGMKKNKNKRGEKKRSSKLVTSQLADKTNSLTRCKQ
jgi:hypothetical protein